MGRKKWSNGIMKKSVKKEVFFSVPLFQYSIIPVV